MTMIKEIAEKPITKINKTNNINPETILSLNHVKTYFPILGGFLKRKIGEVKAVDDVSINLIRGETLAIVGESGCGKTTVANTILNLVDITSGTIKLKDRLIIEGKIQRKMRIGMVAYHLKRIASTLIPSIRTMYSKETRKKIQIVFQDPDSSLNPRMKIVKTIGEPLKNLLNMKGSKKIRNKVLELLEVVSMKREHLDRFPHESSGGQKQRIVIARALACNPKIIVLDEPTSALDVSVQAQILNLLKDLQKEFDLSYVFITHDLSVVQHIADRVAVMYLGKIVEIGTVQEIFNNPSHPYTKALLSARPTFDPTTRKNRIILEGEIPSPINPPPGCAFNPRCFEKNNHRCDLRDPVKLKVGESHYIWCKEERTNNGVEKVIE